MIDNDLIKELGVQGHKRNVNLQWFGGKSTQEQGIVVDMHISGSGMRQKHALRNVFGIANISLPMQSLSRTDMKTRDRSLQKLPVQPYSNVTPKLLIGLDHCHLGMPFETKSLQYKGPFAAKTKLGWVVFGPSAGITPTMPSCLLVKSSDQDLQNLVHEYFELESFGVRPAPGLESDADKRARQTLEATTTKVGKRFQTGLLWKNNDVVLPDSFGMAERRLLSIERKMKRDGKFAEAYRDIIKGYIDKKFARKLEPSEALTASPKVWYLPHFAVENPNKPGKLRLVFDAAASVNGCSLNSQLLKGPQQYKPMPSVLFNFRVGFIAVTADIKEMFHQVLIRSVDRCAQRFLWRDGAVPPDVYEMMVMTFGAACSPCAAQYVKNVNALEHLREKPRAVSAIIDHHYVDDFVDSFESVAEAIQVARDVRDIHQDAGFELRKFASNSPEVVEALDGEQTSAVQVGHNQDALAAEKVLGMSWQPNSDTFNFVLLFHRVDKEVVSGARSPTKRELLSIVMSVFDPFRFLSNFTM